MRDIVSRVYPNRLKEHINHLLLYNGVEFGVERTLAFITGIVLSISCVTALMIPKEYGLPFLATFLSTAVILFIGVYSLLNLMADHRGRFVESVLPDVLKLMSTNLRAGLTIDRALTYSARPEFGHFQKDINAVAGKVLSGEPFEEALIQMGNKIKSRNLEITIDLIIQGMKSGGNLSHSLDKIADILRDRDFVQKEIQSGVQMYVVFIMFAIMIGAPLLFGMSTFLVSVLEGMSSKMAGNLGIHEGVSTVSSSSSLVGASMSLPVSLDFLWVFSIISLVSTSLLGSIVVGLINTGNWKRGVKYMPIFTAVSLALFFLITKMLSSTIGSMI